MKGHTCVGWSLGLVRLAALVVNAKAFWGDNFQSPQISQVASDINLVGSVPVEHVPHGEMREGFPHRQWGGDRYPVNRVSHDVLERVPDDWLVNWAPHDQLGKPASHTGTADSMVGPALLVPQAQQQGLVQSPPVVQVPQAQAVAQAPGTVPVVQVPQVQSVAPFQSVVQVASDTLAPISQDDGIWHVRHGLEEHGNGMEDGIPLVRVPYGETLERFPHRRPGGDRYTLGRVPQRHSEERISDDWRVNWVPQGQVAALDSMVPLVVSVSQAQAQSPPVASVAQDQAVVAQPVAQSPPVASVAQDQAVVAQPVPVVQSFDTLAPVDQDQWTWQRGHGHLDLEAPHRLADLAPVVRLPYGETIERYPHRRLGGERYPLGRVPHRHSEERVSDWRVNWVPQGQLAAQDFDTRTADSMVPPVVSVSQAQQQTVAQSPPVASVAQAQPVLQSPLESPMVTYTRPLVRSVAADCRENSVLVVVKRDLLGIGKLIKPSDVTLGGCAPTGQDKAAGVLLFQVPLQSCGSTLTMRADALVYTFTLLYMPHALGSAPVVRTNGAAVSVECRYPRLHNVSSSAIRPTWVPFLATRRSENRLVFSLKLMSDDWQSPRASNTYFLGDLINIEASVSVAHHVPLRVFVDGCVATLVPNVKAAPRYAFIENHGCLVDAKLTGSRSQFLHRRQPDKLQFQLDAFKFSGDPRSSIYLTCLLKATPASADTNFEYKACSFVANRWVAAGRHERVCGCCDASCSERRERNHAEEFKGEVLFGPVTVHEFVKGGRN